MTSTIIEKKSIFFKILIWINNNFILDDELEAEGNFCIALIALRTNKPLKIKMDTNGQVTFYTDDMELAGFLVQSLIAYLKIVDLQVTCDFPEEIEVLQDTLTKVGRLIN